MQKKIFFLTLSILSAISLEALLAQNLKKKIRSFTLEELISIDQEAHAWAAEQLPHLNPQELTLLANVLYFSSESTQLNYQMHQLNDVLLLNLNEFRTDLGNNNYNSLSLLTMGKIIQSLARIIPTHLQAYNEWQTIRTYLEEYIKQHNPPAFITAIESTELCGFKTLSLSAENQYDLVQELLKDTNDQLEQYQLNLPTFLQEVKRAQDLTPAQTLIAIDKEQVLAQEHTEHGWNCIMLGLYARFLQRTLVATGSYLYNAFYQALYEWMEANDRKPCLTKIVTPEGEISLEYSEPLPEPTEEKAILVSSLLKATEVA